MGKIKGIVLEAEKNYVILLTPRGEYLRLPTGKKFFEVGAEVEVQQPRAWQGAWMKGLAAVILLFLLFNFLLNILANQPKAYMAIDINPSMTLVLNYKGQVIQGEAHNEDGAVVLDALDVKGLEALAAVEAVLKESHRRNYFLSEDDNHIFISLAAPTNYGLTPKELRASVSNMIINLKVDTYLRIYHTESEKGEEALGRRVSLNAVLLGEKMREAGEIIPKTPGPPATIRAFLRNFKPDSFLSDDEFIPGAGKNSKPKDTGPPANPPGNTDLNIPSNPNANKG